MPAFQDPRLLTSLAALLVVAFAAAGVYLSVRVPRHRVASHIVGAVLPLSIAIIASAAVSQAWAARRERSQQAWTARALHLQRLQVLLRTESASLTGLARALRDGRYLGLVGNEARRTVWADDALTPDVEQHFSEYFRTREDLIRRILDHDGDLAALRAKLSAALALAPAVEPDRAELVAALVKKCGGIGTAILPDAGGAAAAVYQAYRCPADLAALARNLFDRAADLADAALLAADDARRQAEETVLRGSCTFAPSES
jgi:hypothetical protein